MENKWKKQKFNRLCTDGMRKTTGWVCGNFGIHKELDFWLITHLPSGLRFNHRIRSSTLKKAKTIVEMAEMRFDWNIPVEEIRKNLMMQQFRVAVEEGK